MGVALLWQLKMPFFPLSLFQVRRRHLLVNFVRASLDQVLHEGDLVTHLQHLHEHPVLDWPIKVIYEDQVIKRAA